MVIEGETESKQQLAVSWLLLVRVTQMAARLPICRGGGGTEVQQVARRRRFVPSAVSALERERENNVGRPGQGQRESPVSPTPSYKPPRFFSSNRFIVLFCLFPPRGRAFNLKL
jgi:hypothetical protein